MTSPAKRRGDDAERAVLAYLAPHAPLLRRTKAGSEADLGDLVGFTDRDGDAWAIQVAARRFRNEGEVEAKAREAARQAEVLGAPCWVLVAKRWGTSDVGRWWAYLPLWALMGGFPGDVPDDLARVTMRSWLALVAPSREEAA